MDESPNPGSTPGLSQPHTTGAPPLLAGWDALSHSIPCSGRRPHQPALKMAGGRSLDTVPFPPAINWLNISSHQHNGFRTPIIPDWLFRNFEPG
jgi:hypothetical protein